MLELVQIRHRIPFRTVWYASEKIRKNGIINYRQAEFAGNKKYRVFTTLVSDLLPTEEEITAKFSKNCKYKVKRAPKEGVICDILKEDSLDEEQLEKFITFFVEFWASKDMPMKEKEQISLRNELYLYQKYGALAISRAKIQDEIIVYHTYVMDGEHARLLHSASLFRTSENINPNIVGMANRYLHQQDMFAFKKMGISEYDWGGAGHTEDVQHITEFKESFGGSYKEYYHFEEIRGIIPKLFMILAKLLGR